MKRIYYLILALALFMSSCSSVKVLDAWKGDPESVAKFQKKNVLVMARTADNTARIAFEEAIKLELEREGIQALESFKKFPKLNPEPVISEERIEMINSILDSEGFTGIVITVVKDKSETVRTNYSGVYVGAGYSNYYPGYYGGFHNYYAHPYAYGPYYAGVGGYIPTGSYTSKSTTYVLETVGYNLDEPVENQLVFVVTSELDDPSDAYKTAHKYVEKIVQAFGD